MHLAHAASVAGEDQYAALDGALASLTDTAVAHLDAMITAKCGSFVGRRLLCVLSGRDVSSQPHKRQPAPEVEGAEPGPPNDGSGKGDRQPKRRAGGLVARVGNVSTAAGHADGACGPGFPHLLQVVVNAVQSEDWSGAELASLQCDPFAGPFLQALLRATAHDGPTCGRLVIQFLGGNPNSGPDSVTPDALYRLLTDRNGSHLVEAAFETAPDDVFQKLCTAAFRGRLLNLSQHPCANFAVQAALASVRKPQQLKRMVEDLSQHLAALLRGRRGGVVAVLLAAAGRLGCLQADCANGLWHSIESGMHGGAPRDTPLHKLLTLDTNTVLSTTRGGSSARLSPLGCATVVTLFKYPADASKKWATALADMSDGELAVVAQDPGGCRVLEAYLEGPGGAPKKVRKVLQSLAGSWAGIAATGAGARFVEKCYDMAEAATQEIIAAEIGAAATRLAATPRGAALLQRCGAQEANGAQDGRGRRRAEVAAATRQEFEELFGVSEGVEVEEEVQPDGEEERSKKKKEGKTKRKSEGDAEERKRRKEAKREKRHKEKRTRD